MELRESGEWRSPVREVWKLEGQQPMTPELEQRLCLTAVCTTSFERAAQMVRSWGSPVADDSTIWRRVQQVGERLLQADKQRVRDARLPAVREQIERRARRENGPDRALVVMLDGWMARERGPGWGTKPLQTKADRVAWREQKTAIVFRTDQRARTQSERDMLLDKTVVWHQGDWDGLADKLQAQTLRCGATTARELFVVGDGGTWIWNLVAERYPHATQTLDFYHASQHLWAMAHAAHGEGTPAARQWAEPLLHQMRHGGEAQMLTALDDVKALSAQLPEGRRETLDRGRSYFAQHADRLHYAAVEARGCPVGSGAMESTCAQLQGRFKCPGQFWTEPGKARLMALELAYRNHDWNTYWPNTTEQY